MKVLETLVQLDTKLLPHLKACILREEEDRARTLATHSDIFSSFIMRYKYFQ